MTQAKVRQSKTQTLVSLSLEQYPDAIADIRREIVQLEGKLLQKTQIVSDFEAQVSGEVDFDENFRNDRQRKAEQARRLSLNIDYQTAMQHLMAAKIAKSLKEVELERLRNLFTVSVLLTKERIATMATENINF